MYRKAVSIGMTRSSFLLAARQLGRVMTPAVLGWPRGYCTIEGILSAVSSATGGMSVILKRPLKWVLLGVILLLPATASAQAMFSLFVGTKDEIGERMIALSDPKPGETVADLGSGDGRLVIRAVKERPGVKGFGVDLDAKLVRESNANAFLAEVGDRAKFMQQNVFDADISKVDVIYMWLFPELQRLLRPKILREARPGTRIVTQMFDMGTWQPDKTDDKAETVRMWIVPADIGGNWNWSLKLPATMSAGKSAGKAVEYVAIIDQVFQQADAAVRVGKDRRASRMFSLRGDQVSFSITIPVPGLPSSAPLDHDFSGTVRGDVMEGKARLRGTFDQKTSEYTYTEVPWRATRSPRTAYFAPTGLP